MSLPAKQHEAILAPLTEPTQKAAADKSGVAYSTLKRWLSRDVAFLAAYDRAVDEAFGEGLRYIKAKFLSAAERLHSEQESSSPNKIRVTAANAFITHALKVWAGVDLERRLESVEDVPGDEPATETSGAGQEEAP